MYTVFIPDSASRWTLKMLLDDIGNSNNTTNNKILDHNYLTRFHFENFKIFLKNPEETLNEPLIFLQNEIIINEDDQLDWHNNSIIIEIDRLNTSDIDLSKLNLRMRNKKSFSNCYKSVIKIIDELFDFQKHIIRNIQNHQIKSFLQITNNFINNFDKKNQLRFIFRIAQIIYESPFENIGRVTDNIPFYSGLEMWARIYDGMGGVCAEKTSALKFICDIINLEVRPVFAARDKMDDDIDQKFIEYFKCGGNAKMPITVQHLLARVTIDKESYLIDVTNGNIPFLFLDEKDSITRLNAPMRLRMVYHMDRFYLKEVSEIVGDGILTISEFHIQDLYYQYIFKQQLGLSISEQVYLGVYFDWGGERSEQMQTFYATNAKKLKYPYPIFINERNIDSLEDENTKKLLKKFENSLRNIYCNKHYTGGFTFVIQPLHPFRWSDWQISEKIKVMVDDFPAFKIGE